MSRTVRVRGRIVNSRPSGDAHEKYFTAGEKYCRCLRNRGCSRRRRKWLECAAHRVEQLSRSRSIDVDRMEQEDTAVAKQKRFRGIVACHDPAADHEKLSGSK